MNKLTKMQRRCYSKGKTGNSIHSPKGTRIELQYKTHIVHKVCCRIKIYGGQRWRSVNERKEVVMSLSILHMTGISQRETLMQGFVHDCLQNLLLLGKLRAEFYSRSLQSEVTKMKICIDGRCYSIQLCI